MQPSGLAGRTHAGSFAQPCRPPTFAARAHADCGRPAGAFCGAWIYRGGDGGAHHFARTITAIREMDPSIIVEVLVPDFHAQDWCIQIVLDAGPDIYNHNMETVERLTPLVRSRAKYHTSLRVLRRAKELSSRSGGIVTKSGVMLGLGEKETELFQTMDDLREVGARRRHRTQER